MILTVGVEAETVDEASEVIEEAVILTVGVEAEVVDERRDSGRGRPSENDRPNERYRKAREASRTCTIEDHNQYVHVAIREKIGMIEVTCDCENHYLDALEALEADEREEALQHARKAVKFIQNMLMRGE